MDMFSQAQGGSLFAKAQRFGKSFMLPIVVLPAAGILLGIGGALSNPNSVTSKPWGTKMTKMCRKRLARGQLWEVPMPSVPASLSKAWAARLI
jgi:phosphotransferase system  glucose/maltose/N-acetylglucosamine-specific IIC component